MAVYQPDLDLLARQIRSIQAQSYCLWTCLIGIDGGEDLSNFISEITDGDPRFVVLPFPDRLGFYRNFERILLRAVELRGDWIALADQDDFWYPDRLAVLLPHLADAPLVGGQARIVATRSGENDCIGTTARRIRSNFGLVADNQISGSLCIFRSALLELALPFPTETEVSYHDHWLGVCSLAVGGPRLIDDVLQDYMQHASNVIGEANVGYFRALRALRAAGVTGRRTRFALDRLAYERLEWRRLMARALLERDAGLETSLSRVMVQFAYRRRTLLLVLRLLWAGAKREASTRRVLGLAVGAIWSLFSKGRRY